MVGCRPSVCLLRLVVVGLLSLIPRLDQVSALLFVVVGGGCGWVEHSDCWFEHVRCIVGGGSAHCWVLRGHPCWVCSWWPLLV